MSSKELVTEINQLDIEFDGHSVFDVGGQFHFLLCFFFLFRFLYVQLTKGMKHFIFEVLV